MSVGPGVLARVAARTERLMPFPHLTEREHEVLQLVSAGLNNADIARHLYLSEKTVRNVVSTILTKLAAETRPRAVRMARDAGLLAVSCFGARFPLRRRSPYRLRDRRRCYTWSQGSQRRICA